MPFFPARITWVAPDAIAALNSVAVRYGIACDFVILDTPPLLPVADALILAPKSDGVLVVADAGSTTRDAIDHVRDQLDHVGANVVGSVLNNLDPATARGYPGYYGYGASRRYAESRRNPPASRNGKAPPAVVPEVEDLDAVGRDA